MRWHQEGVMVTIYQYINIKAVFNQYTKTCQAYNVLNVGVFFRESCWSSEVLEEDERTKEAF